MLRRLLLALAVTLAVCDASATPRSAPTLVGAWRLVRYVDTPAGGAPVQAFGAAPVGLFVFTAGGRMSASIMRNPPQPDRATRDPDPDACAPEWYCSYFGRYTVDWARHTWTVHVDGGNVLSFVGTDQTRTFVLTGDRLVLSGDYPDANGRAVHYERVLERVST